MTLLRRTQNYLKEHGISCVLKAVFRRLIYRQERQYLLSLSLEDKIPEAELPEEIGMRDATPADVPELYRCAIEHGYNRKKKQLYEWISKDYPFVVATDGDKIIGYACISFEVVSEDPNLGSLVGFRDDDAWGADAFMIPEYRRRSIYPVLAIEILRQAKSKGYRRILSTVSIDNLASRKVHKRLGNKEIKEIAFSRFLFLKRTRIEPLKETISDE